MICVVISPLATHPLTLLPATHDTHAPPPPPSSLFTDNTHAPPPLPLSYSRPPPLLLHH